MTKTGPVCFPGCFCLECRQVAGVMDCLTHVTLSLSSSLPFLPSFADSSTGMIAFAAAPHLDLCLPSTCAPRLSLSLPRYPQTKMWMSLSKAWTSVQRWKLPTTYRIAAISVIGKSPDPPVPQTRAQPFSPRMGLCQGFWVVNMEPLGNLIRTVVRGAGRDANKHGSCNQAAPCSALISRPCRPSSRRSRTFVSSTRGGLTRMASVWAPPRQPRAVLWPPCPAVPGSAPLPRVGSRTALGARSRS